MTSTVWMYWEDPPHGGGRAPYLDLCLETIRQHAGDMVVTVVGRETATRWLPDLSSDVWERLPTPVYRSDYLRTRLLHRHGGLWLDADMIAVTPLAELIARLDDYDVVGFGREAGRFYNGLFAARPGTSFVAEWIHAQDEALETTTDWRTLRWAALGQDLVWPIASRRSYHNLPLTKVAPVMWYEWRRFFSPFQSPTSVLSDEPVIVTLWNKVMGPVLQARSRESLLGDRILLSRLLRIGSARSTPAQEEDLWTRLHPLSDARFSHTGRALERRLTSLRPGRDRRARASVARP